MKLHYQYLPTWVMIVMMIGWMISGCQKDSGNSQNHLPKASFILTPDRVEINTEVSFDADSTTDAEDAASLLEIRWDFDNNRIFDTDFSTVKTTSHSYNELGVYYPKLEVRDTKGMSDTLKKMVVVVSDLANMPPDKPQYITPPDWQSWMEPIVIFQWTGTDPENDPLAFDILIGENISTMKVWSSDITAFTLVGEVPVYEITFSGFAYNRDYYWRIAAKDIAGNYTLGSIRKFTTRPE